MRYQSSRCLGNVSFSLVLVLAVMSVGYYYLNDNPSIKDELMQKTSQIFTVKTKIEKNKIEKTQVMVKVEDPERFKTQLISTRTASEQQMIASANDELDHRDAVRRYKDELMAQHEIEIDEARSMAIRADNDHRNEEPINMSIGDIERTVIAQSE